MAYLPIASGPISRATLLSAVWSNDHFLVVVLAAVFLLLCLVSSSVRTTLARVFAIVAIGSGTGILIWAICVAVRGEEIRFLATLPNLRITASEGIGLGAGLLAAGIATLVLPRRAPSRLRRRGEPPTSAGIGLRGDDSQ